MKWLLFIIPIVLAYGMLWQRNCEQIRWNRGFCSCGKRWLQFDQDSQGGRMYKCSDKNHHRYADISYAVDR